MDDKLDLAQNMIDNFADLIERVGFIPNGNRKYYLSRSQPPYFSFMIEALANAVKDDSLYIKYHPYNRDCSCRPKSRAYFVTCV